MTSFPKISIITPSFNQGGYIEETILSVLRQNYPNLEYIIIDGGSDDNTVEIIKKYQDRLHYWVSESDRGQTHAINKGLKVATGEIVGWINSDDLYVPGCFLHISKAFQRHPHSILVYGDRITIDADSEVSGWTKNKQFDKISTGFNICSETAFWRAGMTQGLELKENLRFAMDLEFFCRLTTIGDVIKLDKYLGKFRCYADNKSSTISHVGRVEAEREWNQIFGNDTYRQIKIQKASRWSLLMGLLRHPVLIAFPYLKRRFILGKRGL